MTSVSSKSTKSFGFSPSVSQRLNKVDENTEQSEFERRDASMKIARYNEDQANARIGQRKLTEKEERFKNKYRWAEKQHKLRTGKCEGYSFNSIKAGLRKQDFLDTINWSPVNNAKDVHFHLPDLVKQLLIESHAHAGHNAGATGGLNDLSDTDASQPVGHMSEEDWQLAKSRKLKPLRTRGSNMISSQMNLDAFIDSALSEQLREEFNTDTSADLSLTDLQSSKLIDSRFGWNKVRRAVTTTAVVTAVVKSPAKVPVPVTQQKATAQVTTPVEPSQLSNSVTSSTIGATVITAEGSVVSLSEGYQSAELGESTMFESLTSTQSGANIPNLNASANSRPPRPFSAAATARPSTGKLNLSFHVPKPSTLIRPKSAIFVPFKHASSMVAPVNELVEAVKLETNRPKTSSGVSASAENSTIKSSLPDRPKTATFRIAPSMPLHNNDESAMIDAMLGLSAKGEQTERAELLKEEKKMYENYNGLFFRDPARRSTWQGVDELLSPPPHLRKEKEAAASDLLIPVASRDLRWAGRTLNSYRPWSPIRNEPRRNLNINTQLISGQAGITGNFGSPSASGRYHRSGTNTPSPGRDGTYGEEVETETESASPLRSIPNLTIPQGNQANISTTLTSTSMNASTKTLPSPVSSPATRRAKRHASLTAASPTAAAMAHESSTGAAASAAADAPSASPTAQWEKQRAKSVSRASTSSIDLSSLQEGRAPSSSPMRNSFTAGSASRLVGTSPSRHNSVNPITSINPATAAVLNSASLDNINASSSTTKKTRSASAVKRPALLINLITRNAPESVAPAVTPSGSGSRRRLIK